MSYVIDATLNLQPPTNLKIVAAQIQSGLGGLKAAVSLDIKPSSVNRVNSLNTAIAQLNTNLKTTVIDANSAAAAISKLSQAASGAKSAANSIKSVGSTASSTSKSLGHLSSNLEATAARFTSFIIVAQIFNRTSNAIQELTGETIKWQKEMVKIGQVGNDSKEVVKGIGDEATRLGISLGVSSLEILKVASTLRQANLSAAETKTALQAIARASLAPSFTSTENVVEGLIATMGQFKVRAEQFESVLGSIAAVSNKYAVESNDLVTAIRITGAAFSQAGGSLEELIGLFTSVRQATREAPETIATGLKTIFSRLQDSNTVEKLAELGIQLRDTKGDFVGAFEAFRRLSDGLSKFSPGSQQAFDILQQVGGTRQVGKLIPAINEYKKAVEAVEVARKGQNSLDISTIQSQERLDVKLTKVKESFFELFKVISENSGFKTLVDVTTELIKNLTTLAKVLEPIVTPLLLITGLKLAGTVSTVGGSVFKTLTGGGPLRRAQGGPVPGEGFEDSVPALLMPGEHVVDKKTVKAVGGHSFFDNLKKQARRFASGGRVDRSGNQTYSYEPRTSNFRYNIPPGLSDDQLKEYKRRVEEYKKISEEYKVLDSIVNYETSSRQKDYAKLAAEDIENQNAKNRSSIFSVDSSGVVSKGSVVSPIPLGSPSKNSFSDLDRLMAEVGQQIANETDIRKSGTSALANEIARENRVRNNRKPIPGDYTSPISAPTQKNNSPIPIDNIDSILDVVSKEKYSERDSVRASYSPRMNREAMERMRQNTINIGRESAYFIGWTNENRMKSGKYNIGPTGPRERNVQDLFSGRASTNLDKRNEAISSVAELLKAEAQRLGADVRAADAKIFDAAKKFVNENQKVTTDKGKIIGAAFNESTLTSVGVKQRRYNVNLEGGVDSGRRGFINATSEKAALEAAQLQFAHSNVSVSKARFGSIFGRNRFEIENQLGATSPIGPASAFVGPKPPGGFVPPGPPDPPDDPKYRSVFSRFRRGKSNTAAAGGSPPEPPDDDAVKNTKKVADNLDDVTESASKASSKLGILTKVLAVGLAASTVNARVFGTPDQEGLLGTKGSKTATGISGFITGGSAGGLAGVTAGSALGTVGSAVGGIFGILIGGISGVITSLEGFNKALREAEVAEAGRKFNEGSKDFLSGKATKLTDAQTFQFRQYVAKAGASAEDNKSLGFVEKATQVPAWFVGQAATVRENQLKSRKEQNIRDLAPIAQAANDIFNKSLDNGIKNPKDFIKSQLGQGIIDARTNLELAQRDPKTDVRTEAQVRDSITKAIIKEIVEKNLLSEAQKKTVATINSVNYAFSAMIIGLEQFNTAMDRVSENTEKKFNESNFRLNAGIGAGGTQSLQLGVGTLGPQGQRLEALAGKNGALDKAELLLPSILEKSFKETAASPGSSILDAVTKNVGNAGLGKEVTEQVINAFRDKDQAKSLMSDFQSGAGGKVVGSILNNFDPVRSIYKQRQADLEQQGGRFVQGLQTVSEINQQIGSQRDTSAGLQLNSARERTRQNLLVNGNTSEFGVANLPSRGGISLSRLQRAFTLQGTKVREGVKDIDLASVSELNKPFQQQQERLTGLQGGRATSAAAIQARLQQNQIGLAAARNSVLQNQETNPARALQGAADVQKFQQEIANNIQALKNLQDTTQSLAGAQEKLARIEGQLEGDKRSRLSFAESFVNASPQERREMQKNSLFAQQAISQGNFAGFNDKQAQGAIAFLNQLGDTRLQTGVDKKGNAQFAAASDIKNQLLINSGLAGGNSNDPLLAQREQLNKTINAGNLEAENASKVLTGVLQDQNNKFISDLSSLFEQYFGRGDVNRAGAVAQSNAPGLKGLQEQAATRQENAPAVSMQAMTDFSNSAQQLAASLATVNIPSEILVKTAGNVNINLNGVEFIGQFSKEIDTYVNSKIAEYFAAKGPVQDVGV